MIKSLHETTRKTQVEKIGGGIRRFVYFDEKESIEMRTDLRPLSTQHKYALIFCTYLHSKLFGVNAP